MTKKGERTWKVGRRNTVYDLKTGGLVNAYEEEDPAFFETEEEARAFFFTKHAYFLIDGRHLVVEDYFLTSSEDGFESNWTEVDSTDRSGRTLDLLRGLAKFSDWSLTDEAQDSPDYRIWKCIYSSWQPVEDFLSFVKETIK